jgi:hypothetical protein
MPDRRMEWIIDWDLREGQIAKDPENLCETHMKKMDGELQGTTGL